MRACNGRRPVYLEPNMAMVCVGIWCFSLLLSGLVLVFGLELLVLLGFLLFLRVLLWFGRLLLWFLVWFLASIIRSL